MSILVQPSVVWLHSIFKDSLICPRLIKYMSVHTYVN